MLQELMPIYSKDGTCQTIKEYVEHHDNDEINGIKEDIEDLKDDKVDKIEDAVEGNVAGLTASGNIFDTGISLYGEKTYPYASVLNIKNALPIPAVDCKVKVKPIQAGSGTPSPENIRPISGTDEVEIEVSDGESEPTTTIIPLPSTLYGGEVDVTNGDGESKFGLAHLTSSMNFRQSSLVTNGFYTDAFLNIIGLNIICSHYNSQNGVSSMTDVTEGSIAVDNGSVTPGNKGRLYINGQFSSLNDFNAWLDNNNVDLAYELATPTTISFDPTDVELLEGTNVVSANTGDITMTVKYDRLADLEDRVTALENA